MRPGFAAAVALGLAAALAGPSWAAGPEAAPAFSAPASGDGADAAWDAAAAFAAMERLGAEIMVLEGLRGVQRELLSLNRERGRNGASPAVLPAALCGVPAIGAWCALLPATFGGAGAQAADGDPGSGDSGGEEEKLR